MECEISSIKSRQRRDDFQLDIDTKIAIDILNRSTRDFVAFANLKSFLIASHDSTAIEKILGTAILHFAAHNSSVFEWMIENKNLLLPEFNVFAFTKNLVISRLIYQKSDFGKSYRFDWKKTLFTDKTAMTKLATYFSESEMLLIKTVFGIDF
ncbi:MAG: hypothetical protein AAGE59_11625 [Cyanobacteria bacterium P01_F01_bin.86]